MVGKKSKPCKTPTTVYDPRVLRADIPELLVPVVAPHGEERSATAALEISVLKALERVRC